jgi:hypothetical protein
MFSRLREPFGKAGLIVAVMALVVALGGGAIAANSGGDATASAKKKNKAKKKAKGATVAQVRKIAKQEARKFANSNPGPQGPQGLPGIQGPAGKDGVGSKGDTGDNGKSAAVTEIPAEEEGCNELGGAEVKQEGAAEGVEVCNGPEGSPWTAGGTLPSGETMTGTYATAAMEGVGLVAGLSFPIPLAAPLGGGDVVIVKSAEASPVACDDGDAENGAPGPANPEADPGKLCLFVGSVVAPGAPVAIVNPTTGTPGASVAGAAALSGAASLGTWAVTAP